jgi:hypothetical protein
MALMRPGALLARAQRTRWGARRSASRGRSQRQARRCHDGPAQAAHTRLAAAATRLLAASQARRQRLVQAAARWPADAAAGPCSTRRRQRRRGPAQRASTAAAAPARRRRRPPHQRRPRRTRPRPRPRPCLRRAAAAAPRRRARPRPRGRTPQRSRRSWHSSSRSTAAAACWSFTSRCAALRARSALLAAAVTRTCRPLHGRVEAPGGMLGPLLGRPQESCSAPSWGGPSGVAGAHPRAALGLAAALRIVGSRPHAPRP